MCLTDKRTRSPRVEARVLLHWARSSSPEECPKVIRIFKPAHLNLRSNGRRVITQLSGHAISASRYLAPRSFGQPAGQSTDRPGFAGRSPSLAGLQVEVPGPRARQNEPRVRNKGGRALTRPTVFRVSVFVPAARRDYRLPKRSPRAMAKALAITGIASH